MWKSSHGCRQRRQRCSPPRPSGCSRQRRVMRRPCRTSVQGSLPMKRYVPRLQRNAPYCVRPTTSPMSFMSVTEELLPTRPLNNSRGTFPCQTTARCKCSCQYLPIAPGTLIGSPALTLVRAWRTVPARSPRSLSSATSKLSKRGTLGRANDLDVAARRSRRRPVPHHEQDRGARGATGRGDWRAYLPVGVARTPHVHLGSRAVTSGKRALAREGRL